MMDDRFSGARNPFVKGIPIAAQKRPGGGPGRSGFRIEVRADYFVFAIFIRRSTVRQE